ncbi:protein kinase [Candidatus Obscuribacterales bacterium]|nr:protein kinase [Candidatus Obscuribacterales bacterium]
MTDGKNICPKCRRPRSADGSITQWISLCTCELNAVSTPLDATSAPAVHLCAQCGKRSSAGRAGSFTQWILRSDICSCAIPEFETAVNHSARKPSTGGESSSRVEEEELELDPDTFPLERYKAVAIVGQGAAGTVYRCRDRLLGKWVAIKCLRAITPDQLVAFQNEARATSLLNHPGVVRILDFGSTAGGAPFMVMELVRGESIKSLLETNGPSSESVAIPIFIRIAEALEHAHARNVFHRDLKSSNIILINNDGQNPDVRIIDFGVAAVKRLTQEPTIHQGRTIVGTPLYMSPDQARGLAFDERSEVYNLGCVMFEMLTGRLPFDGETAMEIIGKHASEKPPRLTDVNEDYQASPEIESLVAKCLEKEPDQRFQSMSDLIAALKTIDPQIRESEPAKSNQGRFKKVGAWVAIISSLMAVVCLFYFQHKSESEISEVARSKVIARKAENERVRQASRNFNQVFTYHADNQYWSPVGQVTDDDLVALSKYRSKEVKSIWFFSDTLDGLADSVSKRGWQALSRMPLERLHFQNVEIDDSVIRYVAKITSLHTLIFNENSFSDRGVEYLANSPSLQSLSFFGVPLTDESGKYFRTMKKLRTLSLVSTNFGDQGVEYLKNTDISDLNLDDSKITDECAQSLSQMQKLKAVRLGRTQFTGSGIRKLESLPLDALTIDGLNGITDDTMDFIVTTFPYLTMLNMDEIKLGSTAWNRLASLKGLKSLSVANSNLTDETMAPILLLPKLEVLTLAGTQISDKSLAKLAEMPRLRFLELRNCSEITEAGLEPLKRKHIRYASKLATVDKTNSIVGD